MDLLLTNVRRENEVSGANLYSSLRPHERRRMLTRRLRFLIN